MISDSFFLDRLSVLWFPRGVDVARVRICRGATWGCLAEGRGSLQVIFVSSVRTCYGFSSVLEWDANTLLSSAAAAAEGSSCINQCVSLEATCALL